MLRLANSSCRSGMWKFPQPRRRPAAGIGLFRITRERNLFQIMQWCAALCASQLVPPCPQCQRCLAAAKTACRDFCRVTHAIMLSCDPATHIARSPLHLTRLANRTRRLRRFGPAHRPFLWFFHADLALRPPAQAPPDGRASPPAQIRRSYGLRRPDQEQDTPSIEAP